MNSAAESVNICRSIYIANTQYSDQRWIWNTSYFRNAKKEKIFKVPSSTCQVRWRKVGCLQNILCLFFKMFIFSLTDSHWRWQCKGCRGENRSFANHAIRAKSFCDKLTKIVENKSVVGSTMQHQCRDFLWSMETRYLSAKQIKRYCFFSQNPAIQTKRFF